MKTEVTRLQIIISTVIYLGDMASQRKNGSSFSAYPALFLLLLGIVFQAAHTGVAGNAVQTRDAL